MKTIVTGGCGFIGSHLVERLIHDGHSVVVIDNLSTGRFENLEAIKNHSELRFIRADISNFEEISNLFYDVDWVFHLAALADIVPSIEKPSEYYQSNVQGTFNVLEASRKANVKRFIYVASSSSYGIPDKYPTKETSKIKPQYPYALTKHMGEELVMHWAQIYKLKAISLRLFNVYGPRARTSGTYGAVFGVFLAQKLANKPYTVVGDGKQSRDFTFVSDVVDAMIKAVESSIFAEAINIGSENTHSINTLVKILGGPITYIPKRPGEPECTWADISKAKDVLNWMPQVSFESGVKIMLDNISYWKDAPIWEPAAIAKATETWFKYVGKS